MEVWLIERMDLFLSDDEESWHHYGIAISLDAAVAYVQSQYPSELTSDTELVGWGAVTEDKDDSFTLEVTSRAKGCQPITEKFAFSREPVVGSVPEYELANERWNDAPNVISAFIEASNESFGVFENGDSYYSYTEMRRKI